MDPRIVEEVKARCGRLMKVEPRTLDLDARLDDVYRVSSFNKMRLINDLETGLDLRIPEAEGKAAWTLAELIRLCERYATTGQPPSEAPPR
jgi:acyl carrier protein